MSSACWDTSRARLASLQAAARDQARVIPPLAIRTRFPAKVPAANHVTAGGGGDYRGVRVGVIGVNKQHQQG